MAASVWTSEWCGDVTVTFGTKIGLKNFNSLYEVHAIVTLTSNSLPEQDCCGIVFSHGTKVSCIGVESTVFVFDQEFQQILHTLQFESEVICAHTSDNSKFLLVGENCGLVNLISLQTGNKIYSLNVWDRYGEKLIYCTVQFKSPVDDDLPTIFVATTKELLRVDLNLTEKDKCGEEAVLREEHIWEMKDCNFAALCACSNFNLFVAGDADQIITAEMSCDKLNPTFIPISVDILKVRTTCDGKYLLVLDTMGLLHVICARTGVVIKSYTESDKTDFALIETTDSSNAVVDVKLAVVLGGPKQFLKIFGFPKMDELLQYPLRPQTNAMFVGCYVNEDVAYVVETKMENSRCKTLTVMGIYETLPENKLMRLLNKKRIDEAESFANIFGLSNQFVAKARVCAILEKLSSENNNAGESWDSLRQNLNKVEDINYVVAVCCTCPMLALEESKRMLQYAIQRMTIVGEMAGKLDLAGKVYKNLKILETLEMIFPSTCYSVQWETFRDADLWLELLKCVYNRNMDSALLLLERHQLELDLCRERVHELMDTIPDTLPSHQLQPWLGSSLPIILKALPESFGSVAQWVVQRSCNMEITEMDSWPRCALNFLSGFVNLCDKRLSQFDFDVYGMQFFLTQDGTLSVMIGKCREVMRCMEDLETLRTKYNCKISYGDYSEDDKKLVAFRLLDWMSEDALVEFIPQFLTKFVGEHSLDVSEIISEYVKHLMQHTEYSWWHWDEAPWQEMVVRLIHSIGKNELKCTAIHEVLKQSPVPWSPTIENLLGMALNLCSASQKSKLQEEVRSMGLKIVILKYGQRNSILTEARNASNFVNYILTQDQPNAVEDAMKVVAAYCHVEVHEVYTFRLKQLVKLNREAEFVELLKSLDEFVSRVCASRFIFYVVDMFGDEFDIYTAEEYILFVQAAIFVLRRNRCEEVYGADLLDAFVNLGKLQVEFGIFMSVKSYQSREFRLELLRKNVNLFLVGEDVAANNVAKAVNGKLIPSPKRVIGNLYRLGKFLGFSSDEISAEILKLAVEFGKIETAVELCRNLTKNFLLVEDMKVIGNAVRDIVLDPSNQNVVVNGNAICSPLLSLLQSVLAYCVPDLNTSYLEISTLMCLAQVIRKHLARAEFSLPKMSLEYYDWSYTPILKEMGLSLDAVAVSNYLSCYLQFVRGVDGGCADCVVETQKFSQRLKQFGHSLLAFTASNRCFTLTALHALNATCEVTAAKMCSILGSEFNRILDLASEVVRTIMLSHDVDVDFAYTLLRTMPADRALSLLSSQESRCIYSVKMLKSFGMLGMRLADALRDPHQVLYYNKLRMRAVWSAHLQKYNISLEDIQDEVALDDFLARIGYVSPVLLKKYCESFELQSNEILLAFLEVLLTSHRHDPNPQTVPRRRNSNRDSWCSDSTFKLAEETISLIFGEEDKILSRLHSILPNVDPYNYEYLEFVLNNLCEMDAKILVAVQGRKVVQFLKVYERVATPSQYEIQNWQNKYPNVALPDSSKKRLPFHIVIGEDIWKILKPELTVNTISIWLGVSNIIALPADEMLMIAGQNSVENILKMRTPFAEFQREMTSVVARIQNKEKAVALVTDMTAKLPPGEDKVLTARMGAMLAFKWSEQSKDRLAKTACKRLNTQKLHFLTEHVLYKYNLTEAKYLSLIPSPQKLIVSLYEGCNVGKGCFSNCIANSGVQNACEEIAQSFNLDLRQIRFSLAEKWLRCSEPSESTVAGDTDVANTLNEKSLKRAEYIFKNGCLEDSVQFLNDKISTNSPENMFYKLRALKCLLSIADPETVQKICGKTIDNLRKMYKLFIFAAKMEKLNLPCVISYLDENHITDILARLWRSHGHISDAVSLMAQMILHFKIADVKILDVVLARLVEMKLWKVLARMIVELSSNVDVVQLVSYKSAWNYVIFSPFEKFAGEQFQMHADVFAIMHMCPYSVGIDLDRLSREFVEARLPALALDCVLHTVNSVSREEKLQVFFDTVGVRTVMDNWWQLKDSGVFIHHSEKILQVLYSWVHKHSLFNVIMDCPRYVDAMTAYSLETGEMKNLVRFALKNNRSEDAMKLVKKYMQLNPQLNYAALNKDLSEAEILKVFASD